MGPISLLLQPSRGAGEQKFKPEEVQKGLQFLETGIRGTLGRILLSLPAGLLSSSQLLTLSWNLSVSSQSLGSFRKKPPGLQIQEG